MQAYVERLILAHINGRLEEARRLVAVADEALSDKATGRSQRVYFVQRGGTDGPIKIGVAASIERRMKSLQSGNDEVLTLLHECEQTDEISERVLHRRFRPHRLEGEWFKPCEELTELIASLRAPGKEHRAD
jgi:hypothetical protein